MKIFSLYFLHLFLLSTHGLSPQVTDKCYCPGDDDVSDQISEKIYEMIAEKTKEPRKVNRAASAVDSSLPPMAVRQALFPEKSQDELQKLTSEQITAKLKENRELAEKKAAEDLQKELQLNEQQILQQQEATEAVLQQLAAIPANTPSLEDTEVVSDMQGKVEESMKDVEELAASIPEEEAQQEQQARRRRRSISSCGSVFTEVGSIKDSLKTMSDEDNFPLEEVKELQEKAAEVSEACATMSGSQCKEEGLSRANATAQVEEAKSVQVQARKVASKQRANALVVQQMHKKLGEIADKMKKISSTISRESAVPKLSIDTVLEKYPDVRLPDTIKDEITKPIQARGGKPALPGTKDNVALPEREQSTQDERDETEKPAGSEDKTSVTDREEPKQDDEQPMGENAGNRMDLLEGLAEKVRQGLNAAGVPLSIEERTTFAEFAVVFSQYSSISQTKLPEDLTGEEQEAFMKILRSKLAGKEDEQSVQGDGDASKPAEGDYAQGEDKMEMLVKEMRAMPNKIAIDEKLTYDALFAQLEESGVQSRVQLLRDLDDQGKAAFMEKLRMMLTEQQAEQGDEDSGLEPKDGIALQVEMVVKAMQAANVDIPIDDAITFDAFLGKVQQLGLDSKLPLPRDLDDKAKMAFMEGLRQKMSDRSDQGEQTDLAGEDSRGEEIGLLLENTVKEMRAAPAEIPIDESVTYDAFLEKIQQLGLDTKLQLPRDLDEKAKMAYMEGLRHRMSESPESGDNSDLNSQVDMVVKGIQAANADIPMDESTNYDALLEKIQQLGLDSKVPLPRDLDDKAKMAFMEQLRLRLGQNSDGYKEDMPTDILDARAMKVLETIVNLRKSDGTKLRMSRDMNWAMFQSELQKHPEAISALQAEDVILPKELPEQQGTELLRGLKRKQDFSEDGPGTVLMKIPENERAPLLESWAQTGRSPIDLPEEVSLEEVQALLKDIAEMETSSVTRRKRNTELSSDMLEKITLEELLMMKETRNLPPGPDGVPITMEQLDQLILAKEMASQTADSKEVIDGDRESTNQEDTNSDSMDSSHISPEDAERLKEQGDISQDSGQTIPEEERLKEEDMIKSQDESQISQEEAERLKEQGDTSQDSAQTIPEEERLKEEDMIKSQDESQISQEETERLKEQGDTSQDSAQTIPEEERLKEEDMSNHDTSKDDGDAKSDTDGANNEIMHKEEDMALDQDAANRYEDSVQSSDADPTKENTNIDPDSGDGTNDMSSGDRAEMDASGEDRAPVEQLSPEEAEIVQERLNAKMEELKKFAALPDKKEMESINTMSTEVKRAISKAQDLTASRTKREVQSSLQDCTQLPEKISTMNTQMESWVSSDGNSESVIEIAQEISNAEFSPEDCKDVDVSQEVAATEATQQQAEEKIEQIEVDIVKRDELVKEIAQEIQTAKEGGIDVSAVEADAEANLPGELSESLHSSIKEAEEKQEVMEDQQNDVSSGDTDGATNEMASEADLSKEHMNDANLSDERLGDENMNTVKEDVKQTDADSEHHTDRSEDEIDLAKEHGDTNTDTKDLEDKMTPENVDGSKEDSDATKEHDAIDESAARDEIKQVSPEEAVLIKERIDAKMEELKKYAALPDKEEMISINTMTNEVKKAITKVQDLTGSRAKREVQSSLQDCTQLPEKISTMNSQMESWVDAEGNSESVTETAKEISSAEISPEDCQDVDVTEEMSATLATQQQADEKIEQIELDIVKRGELVEEIAQEIQIAKDGGVDVSAVEADAEANLPSELSESLQSSIKEAEEKEEVMEDQPNDMSSEEADGDREMANDADSSKEDMENEVQGEDRSGEEEMNKDISSGVDDSNVKPTNPEDAEKVEDGEGDTDRLQNDVNDNDDSQTNDDANLRDSDDTKEQATDAVEQERPADAANTDQAEQARETMTAKIEKLKKYADLPNNEEMLTINKMSTELDRVVTKVKALMGSRAKRETQTSVADCTELPDKLSTLNSQTEAWVESGENSDTVLKSAKEINNADLQAEDCKDVDASAELSATEANQGEADQKIAEIKVDIQERDALVEEIANEIQTAKKDGIDVSAVEAAVQTALPGELSQKLQDSIKEAGGERVRGEPNPIKKDVAEPAGAVGVRFVAGSYHKPEPCTCPTKSAIRSTLNIAAGYEEALADPGSVEFQTFVETWEPKLIDMMKKGPSSFAGLSIMALSPLSESAAKKRRKRNTDPEVQAETQSDFTEPVDPSEVDEALAEGGEGVEVAGTSQAAAPCIIVDLTNLTSSMPSYMESGLGDNDTIASGLSADLICTRSVGDEYRQFQEPDPADDGAVDNVFSVLCNDGGWEEPTSWPDESLCVVVPTCSNLPTPPAENGYLALDVTEIPTGDKLYYMCEDVNATLSDDSGLNFFETTCNVNDIGVEDDLGAFTAIDSTSFPVCRSICHLTETSVGNKQFQPSEESKNLTFRTGDTVEFFCPDGFFVQEQDHHVNSIISACQSDGNFEATSLRCLLIPCNDDDISALTLGQDFEGVLVTAASGEIMPADAIEFTCAEADKVPTTGLPGVEARCEKGGTFAEVEWPDPPFCVKVCSTFPTISKMMPSDDTPVLGGNSVEYVCKNPKKVPHTGNRLYLTCNETDGEFMESDEWSADFPNCTIGCTSFPEIDGWKPELRNPLLPGREMTYICDKADTVPHNGLDLRMRCLENGTLVPDMDIPTCVPPNACKYSDFPVHPNYVVNDTEKVFYMHGEMIEMRCENDIMVADLRHDNATNGTTYGVLCGGDDEENPSFVLPATDDDWPRCIPSFCMDVLEAHKSEIGQCVCEFTQCSEYVYDQVENQCPGETAEPQGPFCALDPYQDDFNETAQLFLDPVPTHVPTAQELEDLDKMKSDMALVITAVEALLPSAKRRRKRSIGVVVCADIKEYLGKTNGLLETGISKKFFHTASIGYYLRFILAADMTQQECEEENVDMTAEHGALKTNKENVEPVIADLKALYAAELPKWQEAEAEAIKVREAKEDAAMEEAKNALNQQDESDETSGEAEEEPTAEDESVGETRRKRALAVDLELIRRKRELKFTCKADTIYGISFTQIEGKDGLKGDHCCCEPYKGELFHLFVTIDEPWNNALSEFRTAFYSETQKMVDQEVRFLLQNVNYSAIAQEDLLESVTFINFTKTEGEKIGVHLNVHLKRPHWDNDQRIVDSFTSAAIEYRNRTDQTVLDMPVQGRFIKNDYITDRPGEAVVATRIEFSSDDDGSGDGSGDGDGDGDGTGGQDPDMALFIAMVVVAAVILIAIPVWVALRSKACLLKQCFSK